MRPDELVRSTRREAGLSQRQLAFRAGTTQAAVSRIERGVVSPSFSTIQELMHAMGLEASIIAEPLSREWDPAHLRSARARTPEERLRLAIGWNRLAGQLGEAGERARASG
jgi:transcriptional regulator with XRE-family HTH domain